MVQASLDESSDASLMPPTNGVQFRYQRRGVWSDDVTPDHAWLRLAVRNLSGRRLEAVEFRATIAGPAGSFSLMCDQTASRLPAADAVRPVVFLCNTWDARSDKRPGPIKTAELVERMSLVEAGRATLSLVPQQIGFVDEQVLVNVFRAERYTGSWAHRRVYPELGQVTCADRDDCEQERALQRQMKMERLLFTPVTACLALALLAGLLGWLLPRFTRVLGLVAMAGAIVAAVTLPGAGLAAAVQLIVAGGAFVFGVAAVLASLAFRRRTVRKAETREEIGSPGH